VSKIQSPIEFEDETGRPRARQEELFLSRPDLVEMDDLWKRVISLREYFAASELPTCPALICEQYSRPVLRIDFLVDQRIRNGLKAALSGERPFRWPVSASFTERIDYDPMLFCRQFWKLTKEEEHYDDEQLRLVFLECVDKERQKFERLKSKFNGLSGAAAKPKREAIPEAVRVYVWRRDEGKCVKCGSQERLEYDHIIPVSLGGSCTERNIQLLCEPCNRQKSDSI